MWSPKPKAQFSRVSAQLVAPIASDLGLDLYDVEQRGGTLRVTLDTPAGADAGVTLDELALASRLVSRELDQADPIPGRYTLEVTSPGVERALRTPAHFQRELGKVVADPAARRRQRGAPADGNARRRRRRRRPPSTSTARPRDRGLRRHRPGEDSFHLGERRPKPGAGKKRKEVSS